MEKDRMLIPMLGAAPNGDGNIKDRIAGSAKQAKGAVKKAVGKSLGDARLAIEGRRDKIEGKIQNASGSVKDALKISQEEVVKK